MQVHPESDPREKTTRRSVESVSKRNRRIVVLFLAALHSSVSHLRPPVDRVPTRKEQMLPRSKPRLPAAEKIYLSFRRTSIHIQGIFQGGRQLRSTLGSYGSNFDGVPSAGADDASALARELLN